ncbi:TRAPP subunit [Lobaria immixta]|nr:TRAPP subunit [Lobaria immixta]
MSYYFCIVGTKDNPLFELEFGTSKQGGDGVARFSPEARSMNPFIVHSSLDIVDELQWLNNQMYLKRIDHFASSHISAFLTPTSTKFLLLHLPHPPNTPPTSLQTPTSFSPFGPYTSTPPSSLRQSSSSSSSSSGSTSIANNPTSPQTEEAIRQFFGDVFEVWLKAVMNPFCGVDTALGSPVFRARVLAAGKKYL